MESCFWTNGLHDSILWSRETGDSGNDGQGFAMAMAMVIMGTARWANFGNGYDGQIVMIGSAHWAWANLDNE